MWRWENEKLIIAPILWRSLYRSARSQFYRAKAETPLLVTVVVDSQLRRTRTTRRRGRKGNHNPTCTLCILFRSVLFWEIKSKGEANVLVGTVARTTGTRADKINADPL